MARTERLARDAESNEVESGSSEGGSGTGSRPPRVLGFTNMREREMREPFEAMGRRAALVTVEPENGVAEYASALATGARHLRRRETDAILVYDGAGLLGAVGAALSRWYDVPLLVRQNGDIFRQHREQLRDYLRRREWRSLATYLPFAGLTRLAFGAADGFVPVSETFVDIVNRQTGCPPSRIEAVPNSIRPEEFLAGGSKGGPSEADSTRLLTVTNLEYRGKYEGVAELVEGVRPILRRRPEVEWVIAGDGRYHDRLRRYLDETVEDDVRERIRAPGFVDEVADLYADADLFLYASYIDAYPNVVLEAQAAGLAVVTNPAYGIVEQVEDGESGVFVEASDAEEVRRTVAALLDDPEERARLGSNARRRVRAENSPTAVGRALSEAVERIVSSRGDGQPSDAERPDDAERVGSDALGVAAGEEGER